jgi:hypothetical protein
MGAGELRRGMIRRTTGVVAATNAVMTLGGSMASGEMHVDETEIPQDENVEVDVPEGHDNGDRRMSRGGVSDPKVKTERSNQLLDEEGMFAKATRTSLRSNGGGRNRRPGGRRRSGGESERQRCGMKRRKGGSEGFFLV